MLDFERTFKEHVQEAFPAVNALLPVTVQYKFDLVGEKAD
jgi:hypothetical protein